MVQILVGDMREKLVELADCSIDSIVTDPPYHLATGKKGGAVSRLNSAGFMGMKWDGGDIAMRPETWALLLRVAKPGAHLLAFGGTRTFHRVWTAIEDAGWELRDTIHWLHGEGFPKGTDKSKIPEAWRGWNTALKPACEPIALARKPMVGTLAENLAAYGVGALNIDACRISTEDSLRGTGRPPLTFAGSNPRPFHETHEATPTETSTGGRWPANILHDWSDEVVGMFPGEAGAFAPVHRRRADKTRHSYGAFKGDVDEQGSTFHGERGSAARFFWCPKASKRDRNDGLHGMAREAVNWSSGEQSPGTFQSPKTDRLNENFHPTVKPTELMRYLVRLVTPRGGVVLDPFMGSGSTGKAAMREGMSFVGIELDERYIEIARHRIHSDAPLFAEVAA